MFRMWLRVRKVRKMWDAAIAGSRFMDAMLQDASVDRATRRRLQSALAHGKPMPEEVRALGLSVRRPT